MNLFRQFATFFSVGLAATITDYSTRAAALEFVGARPTECAMAGYFMGGCVSYTLNRAHTFRTNRTHVEAGWRFLAVMAVGFSLTVFFVWLFTDGLGLPETRLRDYGSFVATTGIVFCWNYLAHKFWTFAEPV